MVDFMEIRVLIATIIGIIMLVTIVIATVVMMGGLLDLSVNECIPAEYNASSSDWKGEYCGLSSGSNVYCGILLLGDRWLRDKCMDSSKNLCCPTTQKNIRIIGEKCYNITKI